MAAADNTETATDFNRMNPFGPGSSADETRQAEFTESNDTPTDVNLNAVCARVQAASFSLMQNNFEANAMRFNGLMNHSAAVLAQK